MTDAAADRTLDARGLACPRPVFEARLRLESMAIGEVLDVLADDPLAELDLKVFCDRTGHEFVSCEDGGDHQVIRIRRAAGSAAS